MLNPIRRRGGLGEDPLVYGPTDEQLGITPPSFYGPTLEQLGVKTAAQSAQDQVRAMFSTGAMSASIGWMVGGVGFLVLLAALKGGR